MSKCLTIQDGNANETQKLKKVSQIKVFALSVTKCFFVRYFGIYSVAIYKSISTFRGDQAHSGLSMNKY